MYQPGDKFGSYEILAPLKSGGMASLFVARRIGPAGFSRPVAIKVIHPHLASDSEFIRMFLEEANLAARIQHPNVVNTEELGEYDGTYFLVMEYVHGCTLGAFLGTLKESGRTLAPDIALHIATKLAEGLHAAHETRDDRGRLLGVVHRDVSPPNVLLSYSGHVKLIDFGVAKARGRSPTTAGQIKGKIRYMSPEQARGRTVDRRSDVFALGILLWEMLTGQRLIAAADDIVALRTVREPTIPPPSSLVPTLPSDVDAVVKAALMREPEDRFQTAQAFRRALSSVSRGAYAVDSEDMAHLLAEVMRAQLDREREQLPRSLTQGLRLPNPPASVSGDEVAAAVQWTLNPSSSNDVNRSKTVDWIDPVQVPRIPIATPEAAAVAIRAPAPEVPKNATPSRPRRAGSRGSRLALGVAIAALVTAAVIVPLSFMLGMRHGTSTPSSPEPATPDAGTHR